MLCDAMPESKVKSDTDPKEDGFVNMMKYLALSSRLAKTKSLSEQLTIIVSKMRANSMTNSKFCSYFLYQFSFRPRSVAFSNLFQIQLNKGA